MAVHGTPPEAIVRAATGYGFVEPDLVDVEGICARVETVITDCRDEAKVLEWIHAEKLWPAYTENADAKAAYAMLGEVHARRIVELLAVSNATPASIVGYLDEMVSYPVSPAAVRQYIFLFWNVNSLSARDWFAYFKMMEDNDPAASDFRPGEGGTLRDCFQLRNPVFALWKLGHRAEVARSDAFRSMFHEAVMRFTETSLVRNGLKTAQCGKLWAEVAFGADERLQGTSDNVKQILDELRDIRIRLGHRTISSVEELGDAREQQPHSKPG